VWLIPYVKTTGATIKKGHEAPFPIGLPYKCIKLVPNVKTVLDPFGGTCSTLAACLKLGVKGYAYEKYPRTEVIKSRILEGKDFSEERENLLPHLETALILLSDLFNDTMIDFPRIKSKTDLTKFQILREILDNLKVDNRFKHNLEDKIALFKGYQRETGKQKAKLKQRRLDFKK
jgi:hypothetical protein